MDKKKYSNPLQLPLKQGERKATNISTLPKANTKGQAISSSTLPKANTKGQTISSSPLLIVNTKGETTNISPLLRGNTRGSLFNPTSKNQKLKTKHYFSAFTLVELIVVIVILAILATIAFLSFNSYSSSARDSVRLSDMANIKKGFTMYNINSGIYPTPDGGKDITYSGGLLWKQGTIGNQVFQVISKTLSKKVTDPLSSSEYTYSLSNNKKEYQIAGDFENTNSFKNNYNPNFSNLLSYSITDALNDVFALGGTGSYVKITGSYNGLMLKTYTGGITYVLATPTIILQDSITVANLKYENNIGSGKILLQGINNFAKFNDAQIYSTGTSTITDSDVPSIMTTIQLAYSGSNVTSNSVQQILSVSGIELTNIGAGLVKNSLGGNVSSTTVNTPVTTTTFTLSASSIQVGNTGTITNNCTTPPTSYTSSDTSKATIVGTTITAISSGAIDITPVGGNCSDNTSKTLTITTIPNSCTTNPSFSNLGTLTTGTPASVGQAWTYSTTPGNCTYTCVNGYSGNGCSISTFPGEDGISGTADDCNIPNITLTGGQVWSACNLGAKTAFNTTNGGSYNADVGSTRGGDDNVNGKLYQWGRNKGFSSSDTTQLSTQLSSNPNGNDTYNFVWNATLTNNDWLNPQINTIWGGSTGDSATADGQTDDTLRKGPCPSGWHIPSAKDWQDACNSIMSPTVCSNGMADATGKVRTALLLPYAGYRTRANGLYHGQGTDGYYWSSSPSTTNAFNMSFVSANVRPTYYANNRAYGFSVRCLKN